MTSRTIEIAGGGVAGLSLGVALRHAGVPVVVCEAFDYPRHRTCGEFIGGLDDSTLDELGLHALFEKFPRAKRVAWFGGSRLPRRWKLPAEAIVVSRYELDAELANAFCDAGGHLVTKTRINVNESREGRVFATGRVADLKSQWLGLKLHAVNLPIDGDLEFHGRDQAYVGLCSVGSERVNVCGLFRRRPRLVTNRATAMLDYLRASGLGNLADRIARATIMPDSFCAVAGMRFGRQEKDVDRVEIGDAFAVTPPFTGNGMAMAMQSAVCALGPLIAWSRGYEEWSAVSGQIRERQDAAFNWRLRRAQSLHPFLLAPFATRIADVLTRFRLTPLPLLSRMVH